MANNNNPNRLVNLSGKQMEKHYTYCVATAAQGQESEVVAIHWTCYKLPERRTSALLTGAND
jgi:hypothetical protein